MRGQHVGVGIDHEPLAPCIHRRAPIAQILDQPDKDLARHSVERRAPALRDCGGQRFSAVVTGDEPLVGHRGNEGEQLLSLRERPLAFEHGQLLDHFARRHADIVETFLYAGLRGGLRRVTGIIGQWLGNPGRFGRQQVFGRTVLREDRGRAQRGARCGTDNQTKTCHMSYQMRPRTGAARVA